MRPVALLAAVLATAATGIQAEPTIKATVQQMQSRPGGPYVSQGNGTWQSEPWWVHKAPLPKGPPPPIDSLYAEWAELAAKQAAIDSDLNNLRIKRDSQRLSTDIEMRNRAGGLEDSDADDLITEEVARAQQVKAEARQIQLSREYFVYEARIKEIEAEIEAYYGEEVARMIAERQLMNASESTRRER